MRVIRLRSRENIRAKQQVKRREKQRQGKDDVEGRGTPHKEKWKGWGYEIAPADAKVCVSGAVAEGSSASFDTS